MKYLSEIKRSIGFIFILFITVVMTAFSAVCVKAEPFSPPMFDPDNFDDPTDILNPFLTFIPETAFCYEAETEDGTEQDEVTVTECEQEIAEVQTIVVRDSVWLKDDEGRHLTEDTFDYYAQDDEGNVWYLGEASKECDSGSDEGSWNANDGGEPGIVMLNNPMPGNSYQQEFLEGIAEDMGKVQRLNTNVTDYCDKDCLKTKEWTPLAPGEIEHKIYSCEIDPGIGGLVLVEELKEKTVMSELVEFVPEGDAVSGECPDDIPDALNNILCDEDTLPMNCEFNE